jgi:mannose-6-phosphate isomerase
MKPSLLQAVVQNYAWGSVTAIPELLGRMPDGEPQAELWMGAHPMGVSRIGDATLLDVINSDPAGALGSMARSRFGDSLPFLLKVLAAEKPLSLQAHPSRKQAQLGFDREEAAGIALPDPKRIFKDPNHKPELICALTEFEALCGFRPVRETAVGLEVIGSPTTLGMAARLRTEHPASALQNIVRQLLELPADSAERVVAEVVNGCRRVAAGDGPFSAPAALAVRLGADYPGDPGVVVSLLLNHLVLVPGEALLLTAGNMHAYIRGVGVELMANSDNVLRGGLTSKHVDVAGLIDVLDWTPLLDPVQKPTRVGQRLIYPSPSDEFVLERLEPGAESFEVAGPEILWCHGGPIHVEFEDANSSGSLHLGAGDAAFIPASTRSYQLRGTGELYRATIGP